jgi:hypothetical protein
MGSRLSLHWARSRMGAAFAATGGYLVTPWLMP